MLKALNKLFYVLLLIFLSFLILNQYYVIEFSESIRNVLIFLTLTIILLTSFKELFIGKSGFLKFTSFIILFCTIIGGSIAVLNKELNTFIYICLLFSLLQGIIELLYSKA